MVKQICQSVRILASFSSPAMPAPPSAYLIGVACTRFGKLPDISFEGLTRAVYEAVIADAGIDSGAAIEAAWFSNCGMHTWRAGARYRAHGLPLPKTVAALSASMKRFAR